MVDPEAQSAARLARRAYELAAQRRAGPEQDDGAGRAEEEQSGGPRARLNTWESIRFIIALGAEERARRRSLIDDAGVRELHRLSGGSRDTLVRAMQVLKREAAGDPVGREARLLLLDAIDVGRRWSQRPDPSPDGG